MGKNEPTLNGKYNKNKWFGIYRDRSEILDFLGGEPMDIQDSGLVFICNSGRVVIQIDNTRQILEKNHLFVVFPRVSLNIESCTDDFDAMLFEINANMVNYLNIGPSTRAYVQVVQNPLVVIDDEERDMLLEAIDYIDRRSKRKMSYYSPQLYSNLIRSFCYEVACVVRAKLSLEEVSGSRKNQIFQKFIREVMEHYATEHRVEFYANRLGMSAKYLCMVVKEVTNIPPQNWINDIIIRSAKVMLSTTDLSINEITQQLNFPNPSFFCQYFKRSVGQTPLKYRKCYK
ncbi:MAG: helix-turn-helix transcriptional regulator [Rikenellaceae bacterium]|nr:helix-turn-helix transcriptional regulator [Rikenellaceae bacterium]